MTNEYEEILPGQTRRKLTPGEEDVVNTSGCPAQFFPVAYIDRNIIIDGKLCDRLIYTNSRTLQTSPGVYGSNQIPPHEANIISIDEVREKSSDLEDEITETQNP